MVWYTAICTNLDGNRCKMEMEYPTKKSFVHDLRANGYKVDNNKVYTKAKFDWVTKNTDGNPWDWRESPIK